MGSSKRSGEGHAKRTYSLVQMTIDICRAKKKIEKEEKQRSHFLKPDRTVMV
jgi:hypothetical protein